MAPFTKVSIITVVANGEAHLEQAIKSVLAQTYPHIEYIVIDGASADGSVQIIKKYAAQLSCWISEPDEGMYDAINKGIALCTGELVGILNSDDWYEPDAVATMVAAYADHPGSSVLHGMIALVEPDGTLVKLSGHTVDFLDQGMIEHPACFVTLETYRLYGKYDGKLKSAADYEFMLRLRAAGAKFNFIQQVIAHFRLGGQSTSYRAAVETLTIRYRYKLISYYKKLALKIFWRLKTRS